MVEIKPGIRVVTVAFNPGPELGRMVDSLRGATFAPYELVIVDNGSDPTIVDAVAHSSGAQVLRTGANLGYGGAANLGSRDFQGEWILVVNPDVQFGENSIDELIAAAGQWPSGGAFGPLVLTPEGEVYPSARRFPRLVSGSGHALLAGIWPGNPFTEAYRRNTAVEESHPVDWLSGSCLLLRRQAFEAVGGFDESFFMFFEDTRLGEQLAEAGWQSVFIPAAEIVHEQGKSWKQQPEAMIRAHHRSAIHYLDGIYDAWYQMPLRWVLRLGLRAREEIQVTAASQARPRIPQLDVQAEDSAPKVISVVVTFNPGEGFGSLIRELSRQGDGVIVVDNGSGSESLALVREACESSAAQLVELGENLGIAAAQNQGISLARHENATHVLLSDHDSLPAPGMVAKLLAVAGSDPTIAATGPLAAEDRAGGDQLVYMARTWSPKRATPEELAKDELDVAFLIASGCLIKTSALDVIGLMNEAMFIDHVDLEWGLRAHRHGYRLVAVPSARLLHSLGDEVVQIPGRRQPVHVHAPIRNYYIVRNTIYLIKQNLMPWRWRIRYCYWAAKYAAFNSLLVDQLSERRRMLWRGFHDGLVGRMGPLSR